jgi:hypothetical protein
MGNCSQSLVTIGGRTYIRQIAANAPTIGGYRSITTRRAFPPIVPLLSPMCRESTFVIAAPTVVSTPAFGLTSQLPASRRLTPQFPSGTSLTSTGGLKSSVRAGFVLPLPLRLAIPLQGYGLSPAWGQWRADDGGPTRSLPASGSNAQCNRAVHRAREGGSHVVAGKR